MKISRITVFSAIREIFSLISVCQVPNIIFRQDILSYALGYARTVFSYENFSTQNSSADPDTPVASQYGSSRDRPARTPAKYVPPRCPLLFSSGIVVRHAPHQSSAVLPASLPPGIIPLCPHCRSLPEGIPH